MVWLIHLRQMIAPHPGADSPGNSNAAAARGGSCKSSELPSIPTRASRLCHLSIVGRRNSIMGTLPRLAVIALVASPVSCNINRTGRVVCAWSRREDSSFPVNTILACDSLKISIMTTHTFLTLPPLSYHLMVLCGLWHGSSSFLSVFLFCLS